jgi:hypothetical protein
LVHELDVLWLELEATRDRFRIGGERLVEAERALVPVEEKTRTTSAKVRDNKGGHKD